MNDDRIDLTPLEPGDEHMERGARAVIARLTPALEARRARGPSVWDVLGAWRRPVLATAVALAVLCVVVLSRAPVTEHTVQSGSTSTLSEAAGVPSSIAPTIETGAAPSAEFLLGI